MNNLPGDYRQKGKASSFKQGDLTNGGGGKGGTAVSDRGKGVGVSAGGQTFPRKTKPVGIGAKEKERVAVEEARGMEEIRKEIKLSKEEKEAGLEVIRETIEIPEKIKKEVGVEEVGEAVGVSKGPTKVSLPLDDTQIKKAKKKKVIDSILWLAYWCLRQIKLLKRKGKEAVGD